MELYKLKREVSNFEYPKQKHLKLKEILIDLVKTLFNKLFGKLFLRSQPEIGFQVYMILALYEILGYFNWSWIRVNVLDALQSN